MNGVTVPQPVIDRVVARRGTAHCFAAIDPARTALMDTGIVMASLARLVARAA